MPQSLAGLRARVLVVPNYRDAVRQHIGNAGGIMVRVSIGGGVLNLVGVEHRDIGPVALAQFATVVEVEGAYRQVPGREALTEWDFGGMLPT